MELIKKDGEISVFGHDIEKSYKIARSKIGLVPQEIATDSFEKVVDTLKFSRGLFNKKFNRISRQGFKVIGVI